VTFKKAGAAKYLGKEIKLEEERKYRKIKVFIF
jgi:hypothetical protein